jgi:hypothetical protein
MTHVVDADVLVVINRLRCWTTLIVAATNDSYINDTIIIITIITITTPSTEAAVTAPPSSPRTLRHSTARHILSAIAHHFYSHIATIIALLLVLALALVQFLVVHLRVTAGHRHR